MPFTMATMAAFRGFALAGFGSGASVAVACGECGDGKMDRGAVGDVLRDLHQFRVPGVFALKPGAASRSLAVSALSCIPFST